LSSVFFASAVVVGLESIIFLGKVFHSMNWAQVFGSCDNLFGLSSNFNVNNVGFTPFT
jgi:hypothetical protein